MHKSDEQQILLYVTPPAICSAGGQTGTQVLLTAVNPKPFHKVFLNLNFKFWIKNTNLIIYSTKFRVTICHIAKLIGTQRTIVTSITFDAKSRGYKTSF